MNESIGVAVLMGGPSAEHHISLKSGHGVVEALRRRHFVAEPLIIPELLRVEEACDVVKRELQQLRPDVAFLALHGAFGEDGTVQQICEELRIAYTGSDVAASRLGMDKIASRKRFEAAGLSVPRWQVVDGRARSAPRLNGIGYPCVVKPTSQGSSLGVSIVQTPAGLPAALATARHYGSHVLIEEFIAGPELTVGVLGDEPLPVVEIRPHQSFFDYTAKYSQGATEYLVPAPLSAEVARAVQAAGLTAHRSLGCRHLSRTDIILNRSGMPVILEVNTIPGFTPTSLLPKAAACAGLSYEELCEQIVVMAWHGSLHLVRSS